MSRTIKRHTKAAIFMHWFNAICWFFLLATGLGLIRNPELQPLGQWWPNLMGSIFGGGANLLKIHWISGAVWAGVWIIFLLAGLLRYTLPFIRQIVSYNIGRDVQWLVKKNIQMLAGYKIMARLVKPLGWNSRIPEQDFYNTGQKAAALVIVLGAVVLAATGLIMVLSSRTLEASQVPLVQWSITIHYITAGVTFAVLLVHIYMAAISPEERPAFFSMFNGVVPEEYAAHHHRIWYEKITAERQGGRG